MLIALVIISYLIGSIPTGLLLGKMLYHRDLRKFGSGNTGATNAYRVLGKKGGAIAFVLDFLKGVVAVVLAANFIGTPLAMALCGLFAIIGNVFSVFVKFKGGKGVSTSFGVVTILMPKVAFAAFVVWLVVFLVTRYVSLSSVTAAIMTPILASFMFFDIHYVILGIIIMAIVLVRHGENLERLRKGRESRF